MADILSPLQERFCQELVLAELSTAKAYGIKRQALHAAKVALGMPVTGSDKTEQERASKMLRMPKIKARLEQLRNRAAAETIDRAEKLQPPVVPVPGVGTPPAPRPMPEPAAETAKLYAFDTSVRATLSELACIGMADPREAVDEAGNLRDLKDMPEHLARAVSSIKVHRQRSPEGSQTKAETVEIKFWPKVEALRLIGQHRRMFVELKEIGPAGEFANLSDAELDAEIAKYEALDAIERAQGRKAKAGGGGR